MLNHSLDAKCDPPLLILVERFSPILIAQQDIIHSSMGSSSNSSSSSSSGDGGGVGGTTASTKDIIRDLFVHLRHLVEAKLAFGVWVQSGMIE